MTVAQHLDFSLKLWSLRDLTTPVHTFSGHTGDIKDFDWRITDDGDRMYQLISYGNDCHLKMWPITKPIYQVELSSGLSKIT